MNKQLKTLLGSLILAISGVTQAVTITQTSNTLSLGTQEQTVDGQDFQFSIPAYDVSGFTPTSLSLILRVQADLGGSDESFSVTFGESTETFAVWGQPTLSDTVTEVTEKNGGLFFLQVLIEDLSLSILDDSSAMVGVDFSDAVSAGSDFRGVNVTLAFEEGDGGLTDFPGVISPVPLPAAAWLFATGLLGLIGLRRRRLNQEH